MHNNGFYKYDLNSPEDVISWKHLLSHYSLEEIHNRYENFKSLSLQNTVNFSRIESAISSIFEIDLKGKKISPDFKICSTPEKTHPNTPHYFFRIRKLSKAFACKGSINGINFGSIKIDEINSLQDVWERPAEQINHFQRLSKPKESVLYTSLMSSTAILETNIKEKDFFILITYKGKKQFNFSDCRYFVYFNQLTEEENMKRYILFQLLRNEFTRILPSSYKEENQYCSAYHIFNKFFKHDNTISIQYPSTRGLGHNNFAFWDNIQDNLEFVGFRLCRLVEKEGTQSSTQIFADGFWNSELSKFEYYSPHSEKSKSIFEDMYLKVMISK
ncbi:hypothetical protein M2480_000955 [Parabacteroides sp. PFB2-12]|uniref:hypothetical protein n=1 Tax=unclassified Parabacteroides TaxID=2649774 RepID=UPI0024735706|nr:MULTISPECIES: hypothetical protein [unclassified Parabacteroides]MDH6341588.1 hypothetical protein [Parabacteroides sp. PM6-13]MDH6389989.1 hypothetical protein [Parabacteroides sp. PFB2-12]